MFFFDLNGWQLSSLRRKQILFLLAHPGQTKRCREIDLNRVYYCRTKKNQVRLVDISD